jgi:hypothetical protein
MPLNKFWDWWDKISIKHFLFLIIASLSVLTIGIVGKVWIMPQLELASYWYSTVNTFHWCFIGVGIGLALISAIALIAILDIV